MIDRQIVLADVMDLAALEESDWGARFKRMVESGEPVAMPWYGLFLKRQFDSTKTDWLTGTIQYSLHTATYSPNQDTDDFFNDATNEVSGTNYSANGVTLAGKTVTYDTGTDEIRLDATDAAWTTATIAGIRYGVIWENTAGASTTDPVIAYHDLGAQSVTAANFTVQFDATGLAKLDVT